MTGGGLCAGTPWASTPVSGAKEVCFFLLGPGVPPALRREEGQGTFTPASSHVPLAESGPSAEAAPLGAARSAAPHAGSFLTCQMLVVTRTLPLSQGP